MDLAGADTPLRTPVRDRLLAAAAAAIVVGLFGYLLILGFTVSMAIPVERTMALLDLLPPPPARQRTPPVRREKTKAPAHAPSPRNLRNKATEIVAHVPVVMPPVPAPIVAAPVAGPGTANAAGASDRAGPGEGAGGDGVGPGGGGDGDDGGFVPPRLVRGRIKASDLPPELFEAMTGAVYVRCHVEEDGRVSDCAVTRSSGSIEADDLICRLIQQRFHYEPSRDPSGRPVRSSVTDSYGWSLDRNGEAPPTR